MDSIKDEKKMSFTSLRILPYDKLIGIAKYIKVEVLENYLIEYKYSMPSKKIIMDYLDYIQIQKFTEIIGNTIEKPAFLELSFYPEDYRDTVLSFPNYSEIITGYYCKDKKQFINSKIKVPNQIKDHIDILLFNLRKHYLILDSNLNSISLNVQLTKEPLYTKADFQNSNKEIYYSISKIKEHITNKLNWAEENKLISKELKNLHRDYYSQYFLHLGQLYQTRSTFVYNILYRQIYSMPTKSFLDRNINVWDTLSNRKMEGMRKFIIFEQKHEKSFRGNNVGLNKAKENLSELNMKNMSPHLNNKTKKKGLYKVILPCIGLF